MLRSYVRRQQNGVIRQWRVCAFSTNAYAWANGRKSRWPKADENATTPHSPDYEQRMLEDNKSHAGPNWKKTLVATPNTTTKMAARFGMIALWRARPSLCSTRPLITSPPWTSLRCFSQSFIRLQSNKPNHHDLGSFLAHAQKAGVDQTSNVFKGTRYEYLVIDALKSYGFELTRIGRSNDRGRDFKGIWKLHKHTKKTPNTVSVLGQCKARKVGPKEVRELEGTDSGGRDCVRFLVSTSGSSKGTTAAVQATSSPMAFLQITGAGEVAQFFWNNAAAEAGLGRLGTTVRYGQVRGLRGDSLGSGNSKPLGTIALTWAGKLWRPRVRKGTKTARIGRTIAKRRAAKQTSQARELSGLEESA